MVDPERNPRLDDLADLTLVGLNTLEGGTHAYLVTDAYCHGILFIWPNNIDSASPSDPTDEGAPCLLVDLIPGGLRDGGQLLMQIIYTRLFKFPIPRDPSDGTGAGSAPLLWSSSV